MTKKRSKAIAFVSAFALGLTGLTALPAAAATGDVTLAPNAGLNYGAFSTDSFALKAVVTPLVDSATVALKISTDADTLDITLESGSVGGTDEDDIIVMGFDALGVQVDLDSIDDTTNTSYVLNDDLGTPTITAGKFSIDFDGLVLDSIVIYNLDVAVSTTAGITIKALDAAATEYGFGDGDEVSATVTTWVESEATPDYSTVDATYASPARTVTFYDPAGVAPLATIERTVSNGGVFRANDDGDITLAGTLRFSQPGINLDQVDVTQWDYKIGSSTDAGFDDVSTEIALASGDLEKAPGFTKFDDMGEFQFFLNDESNVDLDLDPTSDYVVSITNDDASAVYFSSAAFVPASNAVDTANFIEATVDADVNSTSTGSTDVAFNVRAGTKAVEYTAQIMSASATALEIPSVLVAAVVTSGSYMSTGGSLSVSGSTDTITKAGRSVISTGFTDADGQWSVTVTSANADKNEDYVVEYFVLDGSSDTFINKLSDNSTAADYTIDYAAGTASTITADESVVSGASVTVSFTVTDAFEVGTNMSGTKAVSVELNGANSAKLALDAPVAADGTVSFTFDNYVTQGAADILTAKVYTGSATSPSYVGSVLTTVTLYNPAASSAVQVPATVTGTITYDDFIADGAKATTGNPNPGNDISITGTIVDANGAGVPAGVVTVSAPGMQIQESGATKFYQDELTISASAAGAFTVLLNAHVVNTTGVNVTFTTPAGVVGTTSVKTYLPASGVTGNNLVFAVEAPANLVMNKTYAVVASLKDKWGNPIKTSGATSGLTISGAGAFMVNGVTTDVTKQFAADGTVTTYVRSAKDIAGPGTLTAAVGTADYTYWNGTAAATQAIAVTEIATDVLTTVWDETAFVNAVTSVLEVTETEVASSSGVTKVNAGSFKGYVAVYAKGYKGSKLSAKVGKDWVIVDDLASNYERIVELVGPGVDVTVRIYIDKVLVDTISLTTK
ncbi:hypothetical protein IMCC13023_03440 [Candidatus Aquiluna sp. IMCC13023]|uniref:beta strand repeat-containing protein n=1 Tax=Candidatus Aquiluna sp. IMCC13023 TaxID=1081644 RepID=UPI00025B1E5F|nr:hypothetical protein [Candidatus Aquiluna sp. IMCC13023]EIC91865.1 hypothetical protein IMCC13023_03440 [Candidatus Aquiluna sp. IMCC13023]